MNESLKNFFIIINCVCVNYQIIKWICYNHRRNKNLNKINAVFNVYNEDWYRAYNEDLYRAAQIDGHRCLECLIIAIIHILAIILLIVT